MKYNNKTIRTMFVFATTLVIITGLLSMQIPGSHALQNDNSASSDFKDKIQEFRENILGACCPLCGC